MNSENMSSGKGLTLAKTTLLPGQERVTVVASLPTNQSCDVTANIPITGKIFMMKISVYLLNLIISSNMWYEIDLMLLK